MSPSDVDLLALHFIDGPLMEGLARYRKLPDAEAILVTARMLEIQQQRATARVTRGLADAMGTE